MKSWTDGRGSGYDRVMRWRETLNSHYALKASESAHWAFASVMCLARADVPATLASWKYERRRAWCGPAIHYAATRFGW
jgi:hypothetical protein